MLILLFFTLLTGTPVSQSQPSRPIVLPEARPIRALPPRQIETTSTLPEPENSHGLRFGIKLPQNSRRISLPGGDFRSVVIVQTDGERQTISQAQLQQWSEAQGSLSDSPPPGIFVANGAVFINTGGFTIPMTGGGASGCFGVSPERNEQIQKEARLQFVKEKAEQEKKK